MKLTKLKLKLEYYYDFINIFKTLVIFSFIQYSV